MCDDIPSLKNQDFSKVFDECLTKRPYSDAICSNSEYINWTFKQLHGHVNALTAGLHEMGGIRGVDSYTVGVPLRVEAMTGLFATAKAGLRFSSIDPSLKGKELIKALNDAHSRNFLFSPKLGKINQLDHIYEIFPHLKGMHPDRIVPLEEKSVPRLRQVIHTAKDVIFGLFNHISLLVYDYPEKMFRRHPTPLDSDDIYSLILYKSDTIGLSQSNLINTANSLALAAKITSDDILLSTLEPFTAAGQTIGFTMPIVCQAKIVIPCEVPVQKVSSIILESIENGVTGIIADKELWPLILDFISPNDATKLQKSLNKALVICNEYPISPDLITRIKTKLGIHNVIDIFGIPETSGVILVNGEPLPGVEIKIVNRAGMELPIKRKGFLCVRGFNTFKGYLNDLEKTKHTIMDEGWIRTPIKASIDSNGRLVIAN